MMVLTNGITGINGINQNNGVSISEQSNIDPPSSSSFAASSTPSSSSTRRRRTRDIADCMDVVDAIGTGTYGVVFKAHDKTKNLTVALKKIKMERETQGFPVTAIREIKILNLMSHEHIVKLYEIITYDKENENNENQKQQTEFKLKGINLGDVFMVFEYVDYDLAGLLKSSNFNLTSDMVKSYMFQLLSGVHYLHEKRVLHRDIKSANLLISKNNILKIADWGLARMIPPANHKLTVPVVTLWYRSPELVFGTKQYSTEVDIWSVGCIFAELKQRSAMFCAGTEAEIVELIFRLLGSPQGSLLDLYKTYPDWEKINFNKKYDSRLQSEYGRYFDNYGLSLLEKLLDLNPATRISAKDALEHRYFSPDSLVQPENLLPIDLAPVTEWSQQEKARKEREEQKRLAEQRAKEPPPPPPPRHQHHLQGTERTKEGREEDRKRNAKLMKFQAVGKKPPPPPAPAPALTASVPQQPPLPPGPPPTNPQVHLKEELGRSSAESGEIVSDNDNNAFKKQKVDHIPLSSHPPPPPSSSSSAPPSYHHHMHPPPIPPTSTYSGHYYPNQQSHGRNSPRHQQPHHHYNDNRDRGHNNPDYFKREDYNHQKPPSHHDRPHGGHHHYSSNKR